MDNLQEKQEQFKALLIDIFTKGQDSNSIEINEMISEIKTKLINVIESNQA
ncbi:hypothetical protein [Mesobacillus foraminis]|uniref:Uncharacterized protein n=1 Tax=Mesobacillus foraminis TaxID=279826 RepID=A0A4V2RCT7_9BACI|nr:hypothetical protein [Mesobacillus foraminis]TCN22190.1 hypothetical protein EV146_11127 [Mesobacillus foraminis]